MNKKLRPEILQELNEQGLGGRLVYIPLLGKAKPSSKVYKSMLNTLRNGKQVQLSDYQNKVSYKTLVGLRKKALAEFHKEGVNGLDR